MQLLSILLLSSYAAASGLLNPPNETEIDQKMFHFFKFVKQYDKQYSEEEFHNRFRIFSET